MPALELGLPTQRFLKALASETRQHLLERIACGGELTVGEAAAQCGLGQSTASEHLTMLRDAGLLTAHRDGRRVAYRVDVEGVRSGLAALQNALETCCTVPTSELTSST